MDYHQVHFGGFLLVHLLMSKRRITPMLPSLKTLNRNGHIGHELAQRLREAIAAHEIRPGERLPSTRALASSLGLARGTVVEVFEQLVAEGYLETRVGAGTIVRPALPVVAPASAEVQDALPSVIPPNAARFARIAEALAPQDEAPFAITVPREGIAPDEQWRRLGNRVRASGQAAPSGYSDPRGVYDLRCAIAEYVRRSRSVHCRPENVIITTGTQQGLGMAGRVLLSHGDTVWAEDPAYPGLTAALDDLGLRTVRLPVDEQGIEIEKGLHLAPDARAAFVTPSHQYPLGMPMSLARRHSLISWAKKTEAWIIEDDYDSELRYVGHPFPAMQGLCPSRVIYLGTFSKVMFPSLRLGYIVAPEALIAAFAGARAVLDRHSPTADQFVLARYMHEGLFEAHIRRIRGLYADRRSILLEALRQSLPPGFEVQPSDQGMHVILWLKADVDDGAMAERARQRGLVVRPISQMYASGPGRPGLMLGFGGFAGAKLQESALRLGQVLRS